MFKKNITLKSKFFDFVTSLGNKCLKMGAVYYISLNSWMYFVIPYKRNLKKLWTENVHIFFKYIQINRWKNFFCLLFIFALDPPKNLENV